MKLLRTIFLISVILLVSNSCDDIINSDKNHLIEVKDNDSAYSSGIKYMFRLFYFNSTRTLNNGDTIDLIEIPNFKGGNLPFDISPIYTFNRDSVEIKNFSMLNGKNFMIYATNQDNFPWTLYPNIVYPNKNIGFLAQPNNIPSGYYIDKVIINNNPKIGFWIQIKIN